MVRACWVVFLGAALACGGQTGEGDDSPTACVDRATSSVADDALTALGFTPADVLAFAGKAESVRLQRFGREAAPLTASLSLRGESGSARFIESGLNREVPLPDPCRGRIEQRVEVQLDVTLPEGEVRLSAPGLLAADSLHRARLSAKFSAADFERLRDFELESGETLGSLQLSAQLTPAGSSGRLDAELEHVVHVGPQPEPRGGAPRAHDYIGSRGVSVAAWPAGTTCAPGELPLAADRALFEITAEQVLQHFAGEQPLRWSDGSETRLTLTAAAIGGACLADGRPEWFEAYDYLPVVSEDPALFGQAIDLTIATADGRFQQQIRTHLQYEADKDGGLLRAWLAHYVNLPPGEAGGWTGVAPDELERARSWELRVAHEPAGSAAMIGAVTLRVLRPTSCSGMTCLPPGVYETLLQGKVD